MPGEKQLLSSRAEQHTIIVNLLLCIVESSCGLWLSELVPHGLKIALLIGLTR